MSYVLSNEGSSPENHSSSTEDEFSDVLSDSNPITDEPIILSSNNWPFTAKWNFPHYRSLPNEDFNAGFISFEGKTGYPREQTIAINVRMELEDKESQKTTELERSWVKLFNLSDKDETKRTFNLGRLGLEKDKEGDIYVFCQIKYNDGNQDHE
jgi:hypothetical protein